MLAVIKTGGKQYKVKVGDKIKVEKIQAEEGKEIGFSDILFVGDEKQATVGTPVIEGASVQAKVLRQAKADKVVTVKHNAKKRYKKKQGHRQLFTEIEITNIALK